jgi:hypothetical protein
VCGKQAEVPCFIARYGQPVAVVLFGHVGKAPDCIEREIDGVQFNMGESMGQCGSAFYRGHAAMLRLAGNRHAWLLGATRQVIRFHDEGFDRLWCEIVRMVG